MSNNLTKVEETFDKLYYNKDIRKAEKIFDEIIEEDNNNFLAYFGKAIIENLRQVNDSKICFCLNKVTELSGDISEEEKRIVKQNVNRFVEEKYGFTILISAVSHDNIKCVKFLIDNGADVNKATLNKMSPLWFAAVGSISKENTNAVSIGELLLENGADIKASTANCASRKFEKMLKKFNPPNEVLAVIKKREKDNLSAVITMAILAVIALLIINFINSCIGGGSRGIGKECPICERTYSDSANMRSISNRGMCSRCNSNREYANDMLDW